MPSAFQKMASGEWTAEQASAAVRQDQRDRTGWNEADQTKAQRGEKKFNVSEAQKYDPEQMIALQRLRDMNG